MQLLQELGLIKIRASGNQKYRYALLVHPGFAIERFRKQNGVIDEGWWSAYVARRQETKEKPYSSLQALRSNRKRSKKGQHRKRGQPSKP